MWVVYFVIWFVMIGIIFVVLWFGEVGMDIFKSLRLLVFCLFLMSEFNIYKMRECRVELSVEVMDLINIFGLEMFDDFDKMRLVFLDVFKVEGGVDGEGRK